MVLRYLDRVCSNAGTGRFGNLSCSENRTPFPFVAVCAIRDMLRIEDEEEDFKSGVIDVRLKADRADEG